VISGFRREADESLTLENRTERLSRNVGKKVPPLTA